MKYLCIVCIPICEVTDTVNQQTSVLSDSLFAVNVFLKAFFVLHSAGQLEL